jgi:glycosyltransferase involved in cell wall biosynthesis
MFPPSITGTSFFTRNLCNSLHETGNIITLITINEKLKNQNKEKFQIIRLNPIRVPLKNFFKHLTFTSLNPKNYIRIYKELNENKPEKILVVNHYLDIIIPTILASKFLKIPLYVTIGTQIQSNNVFKNFILNLIDKLIVGNIIFPFVEGIICWDSEIQRYISEIHSRKALSKTKIIPFGVNGDLSEFLSHKHNYFNVNYIIGVGGIIDQRNFIFSIKVFNELLKEFPDLSYLIIGNEYIPDARNLANQLGIGKKVIFMGERPHKEVLSKIKEATLGFSLATGRYSGLGTVSMEKMLMGVPIISNAKEELFGEYAKIQDMKTYIFSTKDVFETAEKIKTVLKSEKLRKEIGQNGKKYILKNLNWKKIANIYTSYLAENE